MNWDEEYRRLNIEFRALETKLNRCVVINMELLEALKFAADIIGHPDDKGSQYIATVIARGTEEPT